MPIMRLAIVQKREASGQRPSARWCRQAGTDNADSGTPTNCADGVRDRNKMTRYAHGRALTDHDP